MVDIGEVNGLSIDYVSQHIYWTDSVNRGIYVSDYDGQNKQILNLNAKKPRGIVVDPEHGYVLCAPLFLPSPFL